MPSLREKETFGAVMTDDELVKRLRLIVENWPYTSEGINAPLLEAAARIESLSAELKIARWHLDEMIRQIRNREE